MEYIEYTAKTIQQKTLIQGFAEYLNYNELKLEEETHEDFVARKFKEHADTFTTQWANHRIRQATEAYKENLEQQTLEPIKEATTVTYKSVV